MRLVFIYIAFFLVGPLRAQDESASSTLFRDLKVLSSDEMEGRETGTTGNERARNYLVSRYRELSLDSLKMAFGHEFKMPGTGEAVGSGVNLIGIKPGASDKVIVVTAHYDHLGKNGKEIFNGSDDNASGVAVMLYMANRLRDLETRHTIVFVAFDAEEKGLLGARAFVETPPFPLEKMVFNFNMDMVSRSATNEIFASGTHHYPALKPVIREFREGQPVQIRLGHDNPRDADNDWTYSSDHGPFHRKGIPYLYFGVEDHADYHRPSDVYEKTDFEFFGNVAAVLTDLLVRLDGSDLSNYKAR